MKVLQLIDSLDAGGAERMAVNLANLLSKHVEKSYLCSTRKEGALRNTIDKDVHYLFLNRNRTIDLPAFRKLKSLVKKEGITHIHAHGTSFFIATWIKWRVPNIKLIWHEHHGNRISSGKRENRMLIFCSHYFDRVITVNDELRKWSRKYLKVKSITYLPNFIPSQFFQSSPEEKKENVILCLANLRDPKDHLNLLKAFKRVYDVHSNWKLWLIGKDEMDEYSKELKSFVESQNLGANVAFLGIQENVKDWLSKAKIGVLSSKAEGFPMALLEYGASSLAVITTNVGFCKEVVNEFGIVVEKQNNMQLSEAILKYIENKEKRILDGKGFQRHIKEKYSDAVALEQLLHIYL